MQCEHPEKKGRLIVRCRYFLDFFLQISKQILLNIGLFLAFKWCGKSVRIKCHTLCVLTGVTVVNLHLDAAGDILDCDVNKRNQLMVDMIQMEVKRPPRQGCQFCFFLCHF